MVRENRLYQSDWLLRFYGFNADEIVNDTHPLLDLDIDPKLSWALRNQHVFPIDINKADYNAVVRIPGIGVQSAKKIIMARRFGPLRIENLQKLGVAINRAKYFITCLGFQQIYADKSGANIKQYILAQSTSKYIKNNTQQLTLF
ncbi:hypothetical protein D3C85_1480760 [compost metagenome]